MPSFEQLLKEKNKRLINIPLKLQTLVEKQQAAILEDIISLLSELTVKNGAYEITSQNLKIITKISDELKTVFLNEDYLKAVKSFAGEFSEQAQINNSLIKKGFGIVETPGAAKSYIELAKRKAVEALAGSPIDKEFILPIQNILETSVINGSTFKETLTNIKSFVKGSDVAESKILRYAKQITNDSFAIADRSYTSIISDDLDAEWFYYSGSEVAATRCFCKERVGNYYHRKEIESWGEFKNLGECNIGKGWAGMAGGTNKSTIFSFLGGYNCMHSLIPVSDFIVPENDLNRARELGYIN